MVLSARTLATGNTIFCSFSSFSVPIVDTIQCVEKKIRAKKKLKYGESLHVRSVCKRRAHAQTPRANERRRYFSIRLLKCEVR